MTRFVDVYINPCVAGYPAVSAPRWSTDLTLVDSGAEQANQRWQHPLNRYSMPDVIREMLTFNAIRDHWMVMRGPFHIWPWRDPLDFASVPLEQPNTQPTISNTDEALGIGNGITKVFPLFRTYNRGSQTYRRRIEVPIVSSVIIKAVNNLGADVTGSLPAWSVSRPGGEITFVTPPTAVLPATSITLTVGFLFDVAVRFESDDSFEGMMRAFTLAGTADLSFIETRAC